MIGWERRPDGIVVLTLDDPDRPVNTMNQEYAAAMAATMDRLEAERDDLTGVVFTSAKETFLAGLDLREFMASGTDGPDTALVYRLGLEVKALFRRLETLGRPVVAAMTGTALGGGFEHALACHHRIAADTPGARFGLPEVTLGLLPAGGGVTRVVRMLGLQEALTAVLLEGRRLRPEAALACGVIDEIVPRAELIDRAVAWILANPGATQPWDRPGYRMPGGTPTHPSMAMLLPAFPANLRKRLRGAPYPAPLAIMSAAVEGALVDFVTATRIESRWFVSLAGTAVQRNLTDAFFFDLQHVSRGASRPAVPAGAPARRVGVVGGGMMGAGIAAACLKAGLDVVLVEVSPAAARAAAAKVPEAGRERLVATDRIDELAGCDVVIEAVFEDADLKREVFGRIVAVVGPDTLIASNTSSLPITGLADAVKEPADFLGLHFFSPVHRMPLVEIIRGRATSDTTLARGYDLVRALGKTPIVVNDSRGFFTSRIFGVRVLEALRMLGDGVPAASIEQAALQAGYPVGPLAVVDEVTLTLGLKLRDEARKAGVTTPPHPGEAVQERMVREFGRTGKAGGAGFYDYPSDGPKRLWPGLAEHFGPRRDIPFADIRDRMLYAEALEARRCLAEGVLAGEVDGNVGSLLGLGYPAWTGGVLRFAASDGFAARAAELAERYWS